MNKERELIINGAKNNIETYINSAWRQGFNEGTIVAQRQLNNNIIPVDANKILEAGFKGEEIRFRMEGRLFAIREIAQ